MQTAAQDTGVSQVLPGAPESSSGSSVWLRVKMGVGAPGRGSSDGARSCLERGKRLSSRVSPTLLLPGRDFGQVSTASPAPLSPLPHGQIGMKETPRRFP